MKIIHNIVEAFDANIEEDSQLTEQAKKEYICPKLSVLDIEETAGKLFHNTLEFGTTGPS